MIVIDGWERDGVWCRPRGGEWAAGVGGEKKRKERKKESKRFDKIIIL